MVGQGWESDPNPRAGIGMGKRVKKHSLRWKKSIHADSLASEEVIRHLPIIELVEGSITEAWQVDLLIIPVSIAFTPCKALIVSRQRNFRPIESSRLNPEYPWIVPYRADIE